MADQASITILNNLRGHIVAELEAHGMPTIAARFGSAFTRSNFNGLRSGFEMLETECRSTWNRNPAWDPDWSVCQPLLKANLRTGGLTQAHVDTLLGDSDERVANIFKAMIRALGWALLRKQVVG